MEYEDGLYNFLSAF